MENSASRIIIETVVKKTLREIKDSPERSIRNIVDMALQFSKGRFQHSFFSAAQTMLQDDRNHYYELIKDTVYHVEEERLLNFGINLGYNGCTVGAEVIRKTEEAEGYNIPWILTLQLNPKRQERYETVISQGEVLGIHTWLLTAEQKSESALFLVKRHRDSAFILLCSPDDITSTFLKCSSACTNLMIAVRYGEGCAEACARLRKARLLYAVCACYDEYDVDQIENGELFKETERMHPTFTGLYAAKGCPQAARERAWKAVKRARNGQCFQTVAWELGFDSEYIDSIISSEPCSAGFNAEGSLITPQNYEPNDAYNLFRQDLFQILKQVFPKPYAGNTYHSVK